MSQPSLPDTITKAAFDSNIGPLIVQAFLSGLYTFILYRTVRGADMINFAATWIVARSELVVYIDYSKLFTNIENDTAMATALIADALLVWRCYMLWMKSKWLLALFVVALIGEAEAYSYATSVLIPVAGIATTMMAERVVNSTEHD
ncbi:hypothetical protein BDQ17DRAFT_1335935 [Cyathus striatus]|nr:hypothetical protein BDQ17DRAFT_1335935 [Cyathus striatus]